MAANSFKIKKSVNLEPSSGPTLDAQGDIGFDTATDTLRVRHSAATRSMVSEDGTQTLTNKTYTNGVHTGSVDASASTNVDLATTNTASTVDIGTGTNSNTINIGGANSTINITGSVNNNNVTNLNVTDKLITINDGGGVASGGSSGIEVEENGSATAYIETSSDRNSWQFKAPNTAGVATLTPGSGADTVLLAAAAQAISGKTSISVDNLTLDGNTLSSTDTDGNIIVDPNGNGNILLTVANAGGAVVQVGSSNVTATASGEFTVVGQSDLDNIRVDGNTISSTNSNGNINLTPNGVGIVSATSAIRSATGLIVEETGAGTDTITIQAPSSISSSYTLTLPVDDGNSGEVLSTDGSGVTSWVSQSNSPSVPTVQRFTSSSGTYTRPSPAPLYIRVRMVAGGGGGAGSGTAGAGSGGNGGDSTFGSSLLTCAGGAGAAAGNATGGSGGSATVNAGPIGFGGVSGGGGGATGNTPVSPGGTGGSSMFGGGGCAGGVVGGAATGGSGDKGGGGGGAGCNATGNSGAGGGSGAGIDVMINSPASSYAYAVGAAGTAGGAGTAGAAGGPGGAGIIIVEEHYQ